MTETVTGPLMDELRQNEQQSTWLDYLETLQPPASPIALPDDPEMAAILREMAVLQEDIPQVIASRPDRPWSPDAKWLFERSVQSLLTTMGTVERPPWFPSPVNMAGMRPYFFVYVFVAMYPYVRRYHRSRGISDEVSRETLADLGRNVRVHHKRYGVGGLGVAFWLMLHFRGAIYQLGRLQFERSRMHDKIAMAIRDSGTPASPDELVLSMHIPDFLGPLTPESVNDAMSRARSFFATHFPEERYRFAVCHSWLLDPQLADYMPACSNIVQFQRRFNLADEVNEADRSVMQFVFGPVPDDPADLPERTSLERAVKVHLVAGGHWHSRGGWFPFGDVPLGRM